VPYSRPFWEYRLGSLGIIVASVLLILIAFAFSVFLASAERFVAANLPGGEDLAQVFTLVRFAPALILFGSLYLLFRYLTPKRYRGRQCHKWPGPLVVTLWWLATTALLPRVLSTLGGYDLTYGSLAGVIIALFFFFIIGLGVSVGAQLNAALAEPSEPTVRDVEEARLEQAAAQAAEASRAETIEEERAE
jgi:membrane protein